MASDMGKRKSRRTEMSFDKATGRWCAKLGRKKTKSGNIDGHKFRFTSDVKESERRKLRIQQIWDRLVEQHGSGYTWSEQDLAVALAMAEGKSEVSFSVEQLAPRDECASADFRGFDRNLGSMPKNLHNFSRSIQK